MQRYFYSKIIICISIIISACTPMSAPKAEPELIPAQNAMHYWEVKQRMGANSFNNNPPSQAYFDALASYGGEWVRLTWSKWESTSGKTFLMGDPSNYTGLVEGDVSVLKAVVARARQSDVKVVFTPLSLPGAVWTQDNEDQIDDRLYSDKKYWKQSADFWTDVAAIFKDDPTVVAYNLLNEPAPERPTEHESGTIAENIAWFKAQKDTARDLPALYNYIISAIRGVDAETPIMVDGGFFANPEGFDYFSQALDDESVLYAFHMYQPWAATSVWNIRNGSKLVYPGKMEIWGRTKIWNIETIAQTMQQPLDWAQKHGIQKSHVVMGEFGCHRYLKWCPTYMEDVLSVADKFELHWAFYTFRSDNWGGMDYELGNEPPSKASIGVTAEEFWKLSDNNRLNEIPRSDTWMFEPISRRLLTNKEMP